MNTAREFIAAMAEQISMPDIYLEIRQLIGQQRLNMQNYVQLIKQDSALSNKLIRIANSHYFGYPNRAKDLYQALSLIGIIQLHDIILTSLSLRTFASVPQQIFNLEAFWKYSIQCGIAARTIAQYSQIIPLNPYFTLGLLHEIGHAAIYIKQPELSLQAMDKIQNQNAGTTESENEFLGFDYTQVGTELMKMWHLPEIYQQVTSFHLHPEKADEAHRQTVQIIHLAHMICQDPVPGKHQALFKKLTADDKQLKKLPNNIDKIIINEISEHADTILQILWPNYIPALAATDRPPKGQVSYS